jgi:hypothetical protein
MPHIDKGLALRPLNNSPDIPERSNLRQSFSTTPPLKTTERFGSYSERLQGRAPPFPAHNFIQKEHPSFSLTKTNGLTQRQIVLVRKKANTKFRDIHPDYATWEC